MTTPWEDRRGMFQKGREVHEPSSPVERRSSITEAVRGASVSSANGLEKTTSNASAGAPSSPTGQRRRSSNTGGLFGNLTNMKRGSEDYGERRSSHHDQAQSGMLSGWYNSTFRGGMKNQPAASQPATQKESTRGVME